MLATAKNGGAWLQPAACEDIIDFAKSRQQPDGGFCGRDNGDSDLYYTIFGAGILECLGQRAALMSLRRYLKSFGVGEGLDLVHLACLTRLRARAMFRGGPKEQRKILFLLETYRSADGGYHNSRQNASHGTAYAAFLALLAYTETKLPVPNGGKLLDSLKKLRTSDGAYANEIDAVTGQTNATAATLLVQRNLGEPPHPKTVDWLMARHHPKGGFFASPTAPMPDLLSTATALFALQAVGASLDAIREPCMESVELLWHDEGGFCGHLADDTPDCEYTFYALLALGVLR